MRRTAFRWLIRVGVVVVGLAATGAVVAEDAADAQAAAATHRLRYRFAPNQFLHYDVVHKGAIHTQKDEISERTSSVTESRKHLRVVAVEADGTAVVEPVIERVRMAVRFGDQAPTKFDSESTDEPLPPFRAVKRSIGKATTRMRIAPHGKLLSVTPLDAGDATVRPAASDPEDDPSQNFLVVFPEQPIAIGGTWREEFTTTVTVNRTLKQPVKLLREYTLRSVAGTVATIDSKMSVLTPLQEPDAQAQLIQRTPSGSMTFDLERGVLLSRTVTVDKEVYGVFGPKSVMHALSELTERLVDPAATARTEKTKG